MPVEHIRRILISTVVPPGGVTAMTGFIANCLVERGYEPVIAYYEPYSLSPELSVPSFSLLRRRIGSRSSKNSKSFNGFETHEIGAWLPELEFTHYMATGPWRDLINSCEHHIAVSGSALGLMPFYQSNLPYLGWIATGWTEDVGARAVRFPWPRRILDRTLNAPVMRALEKRILQKGTILALSEYAGRSFDRIAGREVTQAVLPMPVDTDLFEPDQGAVVEGRIGFSARLSDPRKNVGLLLEAVGLLVKNGTSVSLDLIGGALDEKTAAVIERLGINDHVNVIPFLPKEQLAERLRSFDIYVLPSHQEGLCIAALEAMACGCPIVSTRCGGPEEYVIDDQTGYLVDFDADQMSEAIRKVLSDRALRAELSQGARQLIERRYNREAAASIFWDNFEATFTA